MKAAVSVPEIASLNGVTSGGWIRYARRIEEAGADALEFNLYYLPTSPQESGAEVEAAYVRLVRDGVASVRIPVAVKISHYFSSLPHMARQFEKAGAVALVLFNRFYQPDIDLETLEVVPNLTLSTSSELRERLRWVAILYPQVRLDLAITGGVHTAEDVLKAMMVGAKVVTMASALLRHGPDYVRGLLEEIQRWMEEHEYVSIRQMQGSNVPRPGCQPGRLRAGQLYAGAPLLPATPVRAPPARVIPPTAVPEGRWSGAPRRLR